MLLVPGLPLRDPMILPGTAPTSIRDLYQVTSLNCPSACTTTHQCARCPTECILTQNLEDPWSCQVSLKFQYNSRNQELVPHRPFLFGPVMTSPAEVKERLRRAQVAILNPDLDSPDFPDRFLQGDLPVTRATSFSHNFISMVVEGPEVVDLSFVDLPGMVRQSTLRMSSLHDIRNHCRC